MSLIALVVALSVAVVALAVTLLYRARTERRRSDARVAALAAALDDPLWETPWADGANPFQAPIESSRGVSLTVPEEVHSSRIPAFAVAALVVLSASALLVAGMNSGGRAPRRVSSDRSGHALHRTGVDATCPRRRDADRVRAGPQSGDYRDAAIVCRRFRPRTRWADRRPRRITARSGYARTGQRDEFQGLGATSRGSGSLSSRFRERQPYRASSRPSRRSVANGPGE